MHTELDARLNFHLRNGLKNVQFCLEHDFQRGWMVFEERVLEYVAANYNDVHLSFERMVQWIDDTIPLKEQSRRRDAWLWVQNTLEGRKHLIQLAKVNVTNANDSFANGKRILTWDLTMDERYDESYIPFELFKHKGAERQNEYYIELMKALNRSEKGLEDLSAIGKKFIETGVFNRDEFEDARNLYIKGCKGYNYRRFQFKDRIVNAPMEIYTERITHFNERWNDYVIKYHDLDSLLATMEELLTNTSASTWQDIQELAELANRYRVNYSQNKTYLATYATSETMAEQISSLRIQFTNIRSRGLELVDKFNQFSSHYLAMWQEMYDEPTTVNFYKMMSADLDAFYQMPNDTYLLKVFSSLLKKSEERLLKRDLEELKYLLNADIHSVPLVEWFATIDDEIDDLREACDIMSDIKDSDEIFFHRFDMLHDKLERFLARNWVDQRFYR